MVERCDRFRERRPEQPSEERHDRLRQAERRAEDERRAQHVRAQLQALAEGDRERVGGHAEGEQDEGPGGHRGSGDGRVAPASVPRDHSTLVSRGAAEQADSAIVSISAIRSGRPI
ncbi:MAG: hypothetical protein LBE44_02240 [Microbacterium hominis]|nr:hypothetical protein [Microbacterium hominis]